MQLQDILLLPPFIIAILLVGFLVQHFLYAQQPEARFRRYFMPALSVKLLGALFYCCIYVFYYGRGDTIAYHEHSILLSNLLINEPDIGWQILFQEANTLRVQTLEYTQQLRFFAAETNFTVVRIAAVLNLLCFNSFWVVTVLFAAISFSGLWTMYRVFIDIYPKLEREMAFAVFFLPSLVFWGSGLMKDTITIGCTGWLLYGFYHLCIKRQRIILSILLMYVSFQLILILKAYIAIALIPAFFYWSVMHYQSQIKELRLWSATWLSALIAVGFIGYFFQYQIIALGNIAFFKFVELAFGFQSWHAVINSGSQSAYSLGEVDFTIPGILSKFPAAVNVTLFRPYLHEVRNPVMLLTSLESMAFLVATIFILLRVGIVNSWRIIWQNPFIMASLIFAITFAFAVGFTSYNFGALARYKIPCLPFYVAAFIAIRHEYYLKKANINHFSTNIQRLNS